MNNAAKCLCACLAIASIPAAFTAGMTVKARDDRLFEGFDKHRAELIARACGSKGELLQNPRTFAFSCVHTNPDGVTIMREISDAPLLAARR